MSIQSWMDEFYPVPAEESEKENAIEHSLLKWQGLTKQNLKKHDLVQDWHMLLGEDGSFPVDGGTCSLCFHYLKECYDDDEHYCSACPLFKVRGGVPCDQATNREGSSPYGAFKGNGQGSPVSMIRWLKKALKAKQEGKL